MTHLWTPAKMDRKNVLDAVPKPGQLGITELLTEVAVDSLTISLYIK
jgi:hypothetical protein